MSVYIPPLASADLGSVIGSIHQLAQGRTNSCGSFTLAANATTTTVSFVVAAPSTSALMYWQPTTADAAAQMATLYCTGGSTSETFVLTHASNTSTDQTFSFVSHS